MNIMDLIKSAGNPDQLSKLAMMGIKRNNPQMAEILSDCINRGESPKQILGEAIEAGKITYKQFKSFKDMLKRCSIFLPFKISNNDLNEMEKLFTAENVKNKGFRF